MILSKMKRDWNLSVSVAMYAMGALVALSVTVLVLAVMAFQNRERVIIMPPHIDKRVEIAWNSANEAYYKGFAVYIASMLGNVTPNSMNFVIDSMKWIMEPKVFVGVSTKLMALSRDPLFLRNNSANYFVPGKITYEAELNKVFVSGAIVNTNFKSAEDVIGDGANSAKSKVAPNAEAVTYEMVFRMVDGRPQVTEFTSYPGEQPHTQKWLSQNAEILKEQSEAQAADAKSK